MFLLCPLPLGTRYWGHLDLAERVFTVSGWWRSRTFCVTVTNASITRHVDFILRSRRRSSRDSRSHCTHNNDHDDEMGIKGLTGLISEHAPAAIQVLKFSRSRSRSPRAALTAVHQEHKIDTLFGRKVAIDASMSIYQFLIAVRQQDGQLLQNDAGEVTRYAGDCLELGSVGC